MQEAVAHYFVYLCCVVCFASVKHYSEQCFDFYFFPPGLQQHSIWRLHKPWWFKPPNHLARSVSPPCYRREADRHKEQWVTQSHAAFCHLWGDGNSASSNRPLLLSHYVCYGLCREQSTVKHKKPHLRCPYYDWKREEFSEQPLGLTPVTSLP